MNTQVRLLYVDDEPANLELFRLEFGEQFHIDTAPNAQEGIRILSQGNTDVLLADERMPGMSGVEFLELAWKEWPHIGRFIVSAYSDADRILRAINQGHAHEYITKPWDPNQILSSLERIISAQKRRKDLERRAEIINEDLKAAHNPDSKKVPVGLNGGIKSLSQDLKRIAKSDASVLIQGETGTGKELIANAIYRESNRVDEPILKVNCASLSENLLQSELFGHEKGAFTGALEMRRGRFELAHKGTLFLDEIGDVSPRMQVSLLRVLQEGSFERVGGNKTLFTDVRIIAATHRDLRAMVARNEFREDLYYRLNVLPVQLPPLRERVRDVPDLVQHFIEKYSSPSRNITIAPNALRALQEYHWPGNIRELENMVQRALVINSSEELTISDFKFDLESPRDTSKSTKRDYQESMIQELRQALIQNHGNCSKAARALQLPRSTFVSRAEKFGLLTRT